MSGLLRALAPYVLPIVLGLVVWWQAGEIARLAETAQAQRQAVADMRADVNAAGERQAAQRADLLRLELTQDRFRSALEQRTQDIETLKHENPQIRRWADDVLPDPVARLRERPALTGAEDYAQYLRAREPVPAAGGGAANERRHADPR